MVSIYNNILLILLIQIYGRITAKDCVNKQSLIKNLTLFDLEKLPCMYSEVINLDKGSDTQIFYWLIHADTDADKKPLVVWLNGGPGASSLFGLFTEMGPLRIRKSGNNLVTEIDLKNTWNKVANILYVDQPVGTGLSFAKNFEEIPKEENEVARQFYLFIQKFFSEHKELLSRNFYITGESYAGKYIPHMSKYILDMNQKIKEGKEKDLLEINLKKILIINGLFDPSIQREARRDLVMGLNMLSENDDELHLKYLSTKCESEISNREKTAADTCERIRTFIENMSGDVFVYDIRKNRDHDYNFIEAMKEYLNMKQVMLDLNIKESFDRKWTDYNETVAKALKDDVVFSESKSTLESLLSTYNLPVILVGGEFDILDGPQGLERMIYSMNYTGIEEFKNTPRQLWKINRDSGGVSVGGYVKQKGKLIFITARNSGHFFPRDQLGLSIRVLDSMFNDTNEIPCADGNCDLIKYKCDLLGGCNGGFCDASTNGLCKCKDNFYGPDCRMTLTTLEDGTNSEFSPRQTKIYGISEKKNFILHIKFDEYKERNSSLIVSMIPKGDHHLVYNFEHHPIQFNMMKKENYFFISEEHSDHILILHNNNNYNKAKFSIHFTDFDFSKSNFWGPGGVGFFFSLLLFITGLVLLILSYLLYKKYRQNKSYKLLSENIAGSDSKELKSSNV
jgi:carboxypeptidase C (cathepsin A)